MKNKKLYFIFFEFKFNVYGKCKFICIFVINMKVITGKGFYFYCFFQFFFAVLVPVQECDAIFHQFSYDFN
jgi:hypothetical protein